MHRRLLLGSPVFAQFASGCATKPWPLVTAEEAAASAGSVRGTFAQAASASRGVPPGPRILVGQPAVDAPLHPPVAFRVRFVPDTGAAIDPCSFRATYGSLGLDITARLLQHARFTGEELIADNIDVPAGSHIVTIAIRDSLGHESSRTFQFTVV
jgi:hypothetical protein